ncbi:AMP-binding protein [Nocardia sp. NPDC051030]|uniref:AMP-binding protein n=1 Tax=Nocardia sp. NPDC051030 TaxID=3155162 RepID=UPI003411FFDE
MSEAGSSHTSGAATTHVGDTIPLHPLLLPAEPAAAAELLGREVERAYRGGLALAPITNPAHAHYLPAYVPDTAAVVLSTSGSSGIPKRTLLPRAALRASGRATSERLGGDGDWLLCLPAGFVAGFQVISRAVLGGTRVTTLGSGHFDPAEFSAAARRMRPGRRYTSLVPTQIKRLLADPEATAALAEFDRVLIGGAALDAETAARLHAVTDGVLTYGMTETCGGCVYDGRPLDGVQVRIVDGIIHIGGEVVAGGYLESSDTESGGFYTESGRRWYRTADRGHLDGDRLIPTGRVDDLINTGGVKVSAAAVERVLAASDLVDTAVVMGIPDPEWGELVGAYLVVREGISTSDIELLRDLIRDRLGRASVPKRIVVRTDLPLLPNSKIDRRTIRERLILAADGPAGRD